MDTQQRIKLYLTDMTVGQQKMNFAYKEIFNLKLPLLNNYNIHQLELVKAAANTNESVYEEIISSTDKDAEDKILAIVAETYERLIEPVVNLRTTLTDRVADVLPRIENLSRDLAQYEKSAQMNTEFFMYIILFHCLIAF